MKLDWTKKFFLSAFFWLLAVTIFSYFFFGLERFLAAPLGMILLLVGFKITELLVAVFTKVRQANGMAVGLLLLAKLGWWAVVFIASQRVTSALIAPLILGFVGFFGALLTVVVRLYGWPKISPVKQSGDS